MAESPYYLRVLPGEPVPRRSVVEGEGRSFAAVGREAVFWVAVRDEFGNRRVCHSPSTFPHLEAGCPLGRKGPRSGQLVPLQPMPALVNAQAHKYIVRLQGETEVL